MRIDDQYSTTSAADFMAKLKNHDLPKIHDFTDNGKCMDCGNCCGNFIPLSEVEVYRIRKYIKDHNICRQKPLFIPGPWVKPTMHNQCPFLMDKDEHRCAIYPVRPDVCREWSCHDPVHNERLRDVALNNDLRITNMYMTFFPVETYWEMTVILQKENE